VRHESPDTNEKNEWGALGIPSCRKAG